MNLDRLRTRRRIAGAYRELGYEVLEQPRPDDLPPFLRDFTPDLIAMKGDDNAIILIRTANEIRGSGEISQLTDAVAAQSRWRFEVISMGRASNQS